MGGFYPSALLYRAEGPERFYDFWFLNRRQTGPYLYDLSRTNNNDGVTLALVSPATSNP